MVKETHGRYTRRNKHILKAVKAAPPAQTNPTAALQSTTTVDKKWILEIVPIVGLIEGEIESIVDREGIKSHYDNWPEARKAGMLLSEVGGVANVTVISVTSKVTKFRGETWEGGRCVSTDGGTTLLRKIREENL